MSEAYWMPDGAARTTADTGADMEPVEMPVVEAAGLTEDMIPGLPENVAAAKAQRDEAWKRWHEQCMAWFEVYEEVHGEPVPNA